MSNFSQKGITPFGFLFLKLFTVYIVFCATLFIIKLMDKILNLPSGDYIAGFVDGEGCFYLTYRSEKKFKRKGQPVYYRWVAYFAIVLRKDEEEIINAIKNVLNCGTVSFSNNCIRFNVQNMSDVINKIIPFFKKHPLMAKKKDDFNLWCEAVKIIYKYYKKSQILQEDHLKLLYIRNEMRNYKSKMNREYINSPL